MSDQETSTAEAAAPVALFKKRGAKGKANIRKRPATPPPTRDSDSSDDYSSEDESGQHVKRRRKTAGVTVSSKAADTSAADKDLSATVFTADRSGVIASSNDATKRTDWYDEEGENAMSAKNLLGTTRSTTSKDNQPGGTYKGLANQTSFIQKNPDAPQRTVGPMKAPTNVRTITFMDYKPDICKDYRISGHCGYGDSCIYLHSREDMKQGWKLDQEWEKVNKGKKNLGGTVMASANRDGATADDKDDDEALMEKIPFACIICKNDYREPVVTRCGHYFCEPCALKRYRKDPTCAACGASTNGVFNAAKRLKKLLEKKRERVERRRQEKIEAGEPLSDEEDGAPEAS